MNESEKGSSGTKRDRTFSQDGKGVGLEEVTIMKLMEEIMEFDQEIKMKQRWINSRMKLLHNLLQKQEKSERKQIIHNFLLKLQPEYPKKITVNYDRGGEAIPMPMDSGEPIALEMFKGDPIELLSQELYDSLKGQQIQMMPQQKEDEANAEKNEDIKQE